MTPPRRAAEPSFDEDEFSPARPARRGRLHWRMAVVPAAMSVVAALVLLGGPRFMDAHTEAIPVGSEASRDFPVARGELRPSLSNYSQTYSPAGEAGAGAVTASPTAPAASSASASSATASSASAVPSVSASSAPSDAAKPSATPSATPSAQPSPSATSAVPLPPLGNVAAAKWATASVNLRMGPSTEYAVIYTASQGTQLATTDIVMSGWQQVKFNGRPAWVKGSYLTSEKPPAEPTVAADGGSGPCPRAAGKERGMTATGVRVLRAVCHEFPDISSYGTLRGGGGKHAEGRAIDAMVSGERGWQVARWARANAYTLGITEVIYQQKIWTTQRASEGWRQMSNRGSITANHFDHVHISVR